VAGTGAGVGIASEQRWADLPAKPLNRLIERLTNSQFQVVGKSTFKDEFVTCGGIRWMAWIRKRSKARRSQVVFCGRSARH
jgi:predicted flavoprotein YhiN